MNYTLTTQSEVPALFIRIKSIVVCLLWNATAIHLILDEVSSGKHQHTPRIPAVSGCYLLC